MSARSRTPSPAPTSAESRTALLPCMAPHAAPRRPPRQLAFALPLGEPDDQLVMPGCEDDHADPRRIYRPPTEGTAATGERKDGAR
jgi:hypothetical protein